MGVTTPAAVDLNPARGESSAQLAMQAGLSFSATLTPRLVRAETTDEQRSSFDPTQFFGALTTFGFGHVLGNDLLRTPAGGILGGLAGMVWWMRFYERHKR